MIAVFCKYENDLKELNPTPKKEFKRVRSIQDIRGCIFDAIIRLHDWYDGDVEMIEAYEVLHIRQPNLFK